MLMLDGSVLNPDAMMKKPSLAIARSLIE